jgi:hypothetical protein
MNRPRSRPTKSAIRDAAPSEQSSATTLVFRASLEPNLYRDFEIADTCTLYALARMITRVFDFDFDHAFGFYSNLKGNIYASPIRYELFADMGEGTEGALSVKKTRASDAFPSPGTKMRFLFDYGDGWEFLIHLVGQEPAEPKVKLPRMLVSVGKAPEQYPAYDDEKE